jgi:hypothetical protein
MDPIIMPHLRRQSVRLHLHALAYNLGNFMRTLAMPKAAELWSLTILREKRIKIGAKVVNHGRYTKFQMAEVAVSRQMFSEIRSLIARLRAPTRAGMRANGITCGRRRQRRCALMQLEQPGLASQRAQPAALSASCARRALLPIAQVVQKGRSWPRTRQDLVNAGL